MAYGKRAHNTLQSNSQNPRGLYPPELFTTLVTHDIIGPFSHQRLTGKDEICPMLTFRPCWPVDGYRSVTIARNPAGNPMIAHNGMPILGIDKGATDLNSGTYSRGLAGRQPVGYSDMALIYGRGMATHCQMDITVIQSAIEPNLEYGGPVESVDRGIIAPSNTILMKAGSGIHSVRQVWIGCTILQQDPDIAKELGTDRDKAQNMNFDIQDATTRENTFVKLWNLSPQNASCTMSLDIPIAKWLGHTLTDDTDGWDTANINPATGLIDPPNDLNDLAPPVRQLFVVLWMAPLDRLHDKRTIIVRAANGQIDANASYVLPGTFHVHSKIAWKTKLYQQRNVELATASTSWFNGL